jgi:hypothetical protein
MTVSKGFAIVVGLQLIAFPLLAQGATTKDNAHIYQGGPKTTVPHLMKNTMEPVTVGQSGPSGGHHYQGGPKTEVPHHMQDTPDKK